MIIPPIRAHPGAWEILVSATRVQLSYVTGAGLAIDRVYRARKGGRVQSPQTRAAIAEAHWQRRNAALWTPATEPAAETA